VSRLTAGPFTPALRAFTPEFACCAEQELKPEHACETDCAAWRMTVSAAGLEAPYRGELCNGATSGSATCTAYFSRETGKLVGTFSFCYD
jgi:hypothetical protein